jgi:phosphoglycerol transferase MdoB-like AlkP superfamily enzyme
MPVTEPLRVGRVVRQEEVSLVPREPRSPRSSAGTSPEYRRRTGSGARRDRSPVPSRGALLLPLFAFALLIVAKFWVTRMLVLEDSNPVSALWLEGGFLLMLLALTAVLLPKWRVWGWLSIDLLASLLCVVTIVYTRQFEDVPTLAALGVARELGDVGDAVTDLLDWWLIFYFVDIAVIAAFFASPLRRMLEVKRKPDARLLPVLGIATVWMAFSVFSVIAAGPVASGIVGAARSGVVAYGLFAPSSEEGADDELAEGDLGQDLEEAGTAEGTTGTASVMPPWKVDLRSAASVQATFDYLQGFEETATRVAGAPEPGVHKGRSVILIQVESLASWTVGTKVNGRPVTPNLDRLIKTSWYAPNMQTQIGRGNTSDAEFTANTSLLGSKTGPASYEWGGKALPSLPRLVRAKGYDAMTFHPNDIDFWRRDRLYRALGFSRWYARPDFPTYDNVGIGASDKVLFAKVADVIEAKRKAGKPFLAEVVTLSSHSPYNAGSRRSDMVLPASLKGTAIGKYLASLRFADAQLGTFIDRLKRDGLWDDTVIVLYGDHFGVRPWGKGNVPLTAAEKAMIPQILGRPSQAGDMYAVPFVVHLPGQTAGKRIDTVFGQVDIMPTITDVLGIDLSRTPHIGASVFEQRDRAEPIRYYAADGTFVTDTYLFKPGAGYADGKVYNLVGTESGSISQTSELLYKRIHRLCSVNRAYLKALPAR